MQSESTKPNIFLFTDGSVNPQMKIGYGAYLLLDQETLSLPVSKKDVRTKRFDNTTSSKLELQALLWALESIHFQDCKVIVFTDCQNTINLPDRRERLEKYNYLTKKKTLIKNHELYKEFFKLVDTFDCDFVKVKGHKKNDEKDDIDKIFSIVDKASRDTLRESIK